MQKGTCNFDLQVPFSVNHTVQGCISSLMTGVASKFHTTAKWFYSCWFISLPPVEFIDIQFDPLCSNLLCPSLSRRFHNLVRLLS